MMKWEQYCVLQNIYAKHLMSEPGLRQFYIVFPPWYSLCDWQMKLWNWQTGRLNKRKKLMPRFLINILFYGIKIYAYNVIEYLSTPLPTNRTFLMNALYKG